LQTTNKFPFIFSEHRDLHQVPLCPVQRAHQRTLSHAHREQNTHSASQQRHQGVPVQVAAASRRRPAQAAVPGRGHQRRPVLGEAAPRAPGMGHLHGQVLVHAHRAGHLRRRRARGLCPHSRGVRAE